MAIINEVEDTPTYKIGENTIPGENKLADRIYQVSETLQRPLYFLCNGIIGRVKTVLTPGEFGNWNNKSLEIIRRIFLICISPAVAGAAVVFSPLAVGFSFIGDWRVGNQPYLCLQGTYTGEKQKTFATFNMSTLLPPMTLIDGVEDSDKRLKEIANSLKDFHFVCGQEVDGHSARFLANELKQDFCDFYTYLGKSNAPFLPSGLFFACKEKALSVIVVPFTGDVQKAIKRELVIFELEKFCVATMHLDGGLLAPIHLKEIDQAKKALSQCNKPVILCGDFNEDRYDQSDAYKALVQNFIDCIANQNKEKIFTCSDALKIKRFGKTIAPIQESIDYITYNKNQTSLIVEFLGVEHSFNLSDHALVKGNIIFC